MSCFSISCQYYGPLAFPGCGAIPSTPPPRLALQGVGRSAFSAVGARFAVIPGGQARFAVLVAPTLNPGFPPAPAAQACLLPLVRPAAALQEGRLALEGPSLTTDRSLDVCKT